jgi:hypothetical protein
MKYTYVISILLIGLLYTPCIADTIHPDSAGYISVISSPSGATVIYDGTKSGVTPVILTIHETDTPSHTIILQKSGYQDWTTSINHNPEQSTVETISATLNQVADSGTISVTSEPTGAVVTCDGTDSRKHPAPMRGSLRECMISVYQRTGMCPTQQLLLLHQVQNRLYLLLSTMMEW